MQILAALWTGASRFNEIKGWLGSISPALLSKRLKEMEVNGLIERVEDPATGKVDYLRTQRAMELEPALDALGEWAQCNIEAELALQGTDIPALMWDMRRLIDPAALPNRQVVLQFRFADAKPEHKVYWALIRPGCPTEICIENPGFDVDLYIETDSISLSATILGRTSIARELETGRLFLGGDARLAKTMDRWLYRRTKEDPEKVLQLESTDS